MKKIFYSMMAVALCACSQSDVDDVVTAPQPENKGVTFTVVDNGFIGEDGTRVFYGNYGTDEAYKATFEDGNSIGLYAIKSSELTDHKYGGKYPQSYVLNNVKLTLTGGVWKSETPINFGDADLLFAYAPYREDASVTNDYEPSFTGTTGAWAINTENNRFFVGGNTYNITDNSEEKFELNDWMGAVANISSGQTDITFNMQHMRGMVELTTHKDVVLEDLTLAIGSENGTKYHFTPYHIETDDKHVYRILTTEYRSVNTIYATIKDVNIVKKYRKTPEANHKGAGKCIQVNIAYTPEATITVNDGVEGHKQLLADILKEKYGANYATAPDPALTSLRLAGTLTTADWTTLQSLTTLTSLDMYQLANTSIPNDWMKNAATLKTTLTTLVLPNGLTTIGSDALQVKNVGNIDIPATVTEIKTGALYWCTNTTIRIPEDSQLATVGNGAFNNSKAVYTYDNNFSVLVLPETLTTIGRDGALAYVDQLKKVVFKGETAPTISNEGINAFDTSVVIYVPNTSYKGKSLFPGKTVYVGPALSVDNYKATDINGLSLTDTRGGSLSALCDGITGRDDNYWHSDYAYYHDYDEWGIFIDITLPKEYSNLKVSYTTRNNNVDAAPRKVKIGVSADGNTFTETDVYTNAGLAQNPNETKELAINATSPYKKVRFGVVRSNGGGKSYVPDATTEEDRYVDNIDEDGYYIAENKIQAYVFVVLSELTVYEETWTE